MGDKITNESFCTCTYRECPHHPQKHDNECTACIAKNLRNREIPECFFSRIADKSGANSNYTFEKFAEIVERNA